MSWTDIIKTWVDNDPGNPNNEIYAYDLNDYFKGNLQYLYDLYKDVINVNLIKNYPSLEGADGVTPDWWTVFSATATEEDAAGEGLSGSPNDRVIKYVTTANGGAIRQDFDPSDEPLLEAGVTKVSGGIWFYTDDSGGVQLSIRDTVSGALGAISSNTTGEWVYLSLEDVTIGANNLRFSINHLISGSTVYIANPVLNVGSKPIGWEYANEWNRAESERRRIEESINVNLIKNYPSLEGADGVRPDWWITGANLVLTEEDATGEGLSGSPNDRVLKVVNTASSNIRQVFSPSDEILLSAGVTKVSLGIWVYNTGSLSITLQARDSSAGIIKSTFTNELNKWVYLSLENVTIDANNLVFWIAMSQATTVYFANPVLNVGSKPIPWKERGLSYRESLSSDVLNTDPTNTNWTDLSFASVSSPLACKLNIISVVRDISTSDRNLYVRRNGSSIGRVNASVAARAPGGDRNQGSYQVLCDENQIIEWSVQNTNADLAIISQVGYWVWE